MQSEEIIVFWEWTSDQKLGIISEQKCVSKTKVFKEWFLGMDN